MMFDRFRKGMEQFFAHENPERGLEEDASTEGREHLQAVASILVVAAFADNDFSDEEEQCIREFLRKRFLLSSSDTDHVLCIARKSVAESVEVFSFVRDLKRSSEEGERIRIVEMLWRVVLADGEISWSESQLMRRMTGLLQVSDRESAFARQRIQARFFSGRATSPRVALRKKGITKGVSE